jgi:hypothetical protein
MKKQIIRKAALFALIVSLILCLSGCVIEDNSLSFETSEGVITVDYQGVVEEEGGKICICRAVHFRALQLAADMWIDGHIRVDRLKIASGIHTDGPEEFVEALKDLEVVIDPIEVDESIPGAHLGLPCYSVLVTNTATEKQRRISCRPEIFSGDGFNHVDFFALRTKMKTGTATNEEKGKFKSTVRPRVVQNLSQVPLENLFEVAPVANPL